MTATQRALQPVAELGGALQRRTVLVLAAATILGGLGVGASLSVGALLLAEVSGRDAISGLASAMFNGGAAIAGIPLARLAARRGRRRALVTGSIVAMVGAVVAIYGAAISLWPVLALGLGGLGVASAVQLLSRFAATDLALPENRARDLSLVVWSITVGAVVGPNLMGPGAVVGNALGVPPLAGVFVFTVGAQALAAIVVWFGLRPDPLLTARSIQQAEAHTAVTTNDAGETVAAAPRGNGAKVLTIVMIAVAQAIMVALMSMTPLHLKHHGGSDPLVGITLSLHIAGMYAFSPLIGMMATKLGRLPVIVGGWAVLLVSIVLSYFSGPSHLLVQVAMVLLGVGWGMVTVAGAALLTDLTTLEERTRWQGRADTSMSAAGAGAAVLAGILFAVGDFALLAVLSAVVLAVGVVASTYRGLRR